MGMTAFWKLIRTAWVWLPCWLAKLSKVTVSTTGIGFPAASKTVAEPALADGLFTPSLLNQYFTETADASRGAGPSLTRRSHGCSAAFVTAQLEVVGMSGEMQSATRWTAWVGVAVGEMVSVGLAVAVGV